MKIYFLHGKNKTPQDLKLVSLANIAHSFGYQVLMIDDTDTKNPNIRAKRLLDRLKSKEEVLLVGGSMGGYASVFASSFLHVKGMFLLAPALYLDGYDEFDLPLQCQNITIVHGMDDEVVPVENSIQFAKKTGAILHIISDGHALNGDLVTLEVLFDQFLNGLEDKNDK